jgi:hypothetical protein
MEYVYSLAKRGHPQPERYFDEVIVVGHSLGAAGCPGGTPRDGSYQPSASNAMRG